MPYEAPLFSRKLHIARNPDASNGKLRMLGTGGMTKDLDGGVCCAMCLLWIKRIFQTQYKDVSWERSNAEAAKSIFLQYMMTQRSGSSLDKEMELYQNHGMKMYAGKNDDANHKFSGNIKESSEKAEAWIKKTPELTCFSIGVTGHAMAGFWQKGAGFFFDPNEGVFELSSINDFAVEVVDSIYQNYIANTDSKYLFLYKIEKGVQ